MSFIRLLTWSRGRRRGSWLRVQSKEDERLFRSPPFRLREGFSTFSHIPFYICSLVPSPPPSLGLPHHPCSMCDRSLNGVNKPWRSGPGNCCWDVDVVSSWLWVIGWSGKRRSRYIVLYHMGSPGIRRSANFIATCHVTKLGYVTIKCCNLFYFQ